MIRSALIPFNYSSFSWNLKQWLTEWVFLKCLKIFVINLVLLLISVITFTKILTSRKIVDCEIRTFILQAIVKKFNHSIVVPNSRKRIKHSFVGDGGIEYNIDNTINY